MKQPLTEKELLKLAATVFARRGGQSKSKAKADAARLNGLKGGRPKKKGNR